MSRGTLDVVLVNPGSRARIYQTLGADLAAIENPVWAGLIGSFVRGKGYSVAIVDAGAENLSPDDVAQRVTTLDPCLVAVVVYGHQPSASTQNMTGASAVVTAIKTSNPDMKVLMLGGHVAALPGRTLQEEICDFVTSDEGLYGVTDLIEALAAGHASRTPRSTRHSAAPITVPSAASRRRSRVASRRSASPRVSTAIASGAPPASCRRSICWSPGTACATSSSLTRCSSSTRGTSWVSAT